MLNDISLYIQAGKEARRARKQHDEARANHWKKWFTTAKYMEKPEDRIAAEKAFNDGYEEG